MRHETTSKRSIISLGWTLVLLVLVLAAFARAAMGHPAEDRIQALQTCLPAKYSVDLDKLRNGLLRNWKPVSTEMPPPPAAYLSSLDQDIRICAIAAGLTDPTARTAIYGVIAKDIAIKTQDCRKFGMGRMVPVHVKTVLAGAPSHGWQVFYRWVGSSLLKTQELRFANLTSPATAELPPGMYEIRVEKRGAPTLAKAAPPLTILVGSEATKEVEIAVQ